MAVAAVKISKKAHYALRAVVGIARSPLPRPVPIQGLAESEGIPLKFLEQILLALRNGGILESKRGVGGGYLLARPADRITVGEVLRQIDGPFVPIEDQPGHAGLARCFEDLRRLVDDHLEGITIADVIALDRESGALAFEI